MKQRQRTVIDDLAEAVAVEADFMRGSLQNHLIRCATNENHRAILAIASRGQTLQEFILDGKEDRYVYCYLFVDLYGIDVILKDDLHVKARDSIRTITLDYTNKPVFQIAGVANEMSQCTERIYQAKILAIEKRTYRIIARFFTGDAYYLFCKERAIGYTNSQSKYPLYFEAADCDVYLVIADTLRDAKDVIYSYLKPVH